MLAVQESKQKEENKKVQDAHEAIRPTDVSRMPAIVKESLSRDQFRLLSADLENALWQAGCSLPYMRQHP